MEKLKALADRWGWTRTAWATHERVGEVNGGATASAVTVMFFVALFPMILVAIAVLGFVSAGNEDLATDIIDNLGLEGTAAQNMEDTISRAEDSRRSASVIGFGGLLWSGLGVAAAVSLAVLTPWQRKVKGFKAKALGVVWLVGGAILIAGSLTAGGLLNRTPEAVPRVVTSTGLVLLGLALEFGFFLWTFWILGDRRTGVKALVPGAILGAAGFEVLKIIGTVLVPRMVASSSSLYGPLGVVFALLAWLAFFSRLMVYASALNAVRWEANHGTSTLLVQAYRFDDEMEITEADRGGAVKIPPPEKGAAAALLEKLPGRGDDPDSETGPEGASASPAASG